MNKELNQPSVLLLETNVSQPIFQISLQRNIMRMKKYLLLLSMLILSTVFVKAQDAWPLTSSPLNPTSASGISNATASAGTIAGTGIVSYSGSAPIGLKYSSHASTAGSWPAESNTTGVDGRYIEFIITPTANYNLNITQVKCDLTASAGTTIRASFYYAVGASTPTNLAAMTAVNGSSTAIQPTSTTTTSTFGSLNINVTSGNKIYFRIYPSSSSGSNQTSRYLTIANFTVTGTATAACTTPTLTHNVTATSNTICNGGSTTIGLDNSQTNVTYQLYAGGSPLSGVTANGSTGNPISFAAQSPSSNTTYTVQSTTANSFCATAINGGSTTSKAITVNSRPVAAITSTSTSITTGNSTSISGTISATGAWTLTLSDASTVTGTGSGTWSKSVSPSSNTTYTISALSDANCSSISADLTGSETVNVTSLIKQTITFNPTTTLTYGVSPITLSASGGGSGNPVTYSISAVSPSGIATLSGTNNSVLTLNGAGSFTITADQAGNGTYAAAASVSQNFTVNKAVLTVTADNQTNVTYGTVASVVTAAGSSVISGYVGSDNAGNVTITGSTTYTTNYTATTAAGASSITITPVVTGLSATNYSFSPANGAVTVTQAALSITANNLAKAFGATQATPVTGATAFTSSGLKNSETIGSVTLTYGAGAIASGDAIGSTSTITPSAATGGTFNAANYSISYNTGTLTVVQITSYTENFTTTSLTSSYTTSPFTTNLGTWTAGGGGVGLSTSGITSNTMKFKASAVGTPFTTTPTLYGVNSISFDGKIVGTPTSANLTLSNASTMSSITAIGTTTTNSGTVNVSPAGYNGNYTFTYSLTAAGQTSAYVDNIVFNFITPTIQASNIVPSSLTNNGATISWTRPNSGNNNQGCIVFVGPSASTFSNPSASTSYTASTTFGSGTQIGSTGYYCVYNGTGTSVTIASGLAAGTNYKVYVMEYNGIMGQSDENYYTASATNNPNTFSTTCPTYTLATAAQAAAICSGSNATINLTGLATHASTVFNYTLNGAGSYTSATVTTVAGTTGSFTAALSSANTSMEIVSVTAGACTTTLGSPVTVISFQVDPTPAVGTASATSGTICTGTATSLNLTSSTGNIQWQQSADGSTGWASVSGGSGATTASYTTANLSATTYFRAQVSSGVCSTIYSSPVVGVTVIASVGGTATATASTLYTGSNTTITLNGNTGSSIQWEYSTDNNSFSSVGTDGSGDGTTTYTTPNLSVTTYYRAVVANGSCSSANSSTATVNVTSKIVQNITLAATNTVSYGDAPYALSVSTDNPSGAALQYSSSNPSVASIDASGNITVGIVGATTITVTQAGDASYLDGIATQILTVQKAASTVTPTIGTYTYNGTAQGPNSASHTGSTGSITYSYEGTGATTYAATATRPTLAGTYNVTATLATDANYTTATNTAAFTIDKASLMVTANNQAKALGASLTLGTTAFTHSTVYSTDGITAVTLTSSGASSGAALGSYTITPSAATGTGLSNYTISYTDGSLIVGTQFTETFDESVICTTSGNTNCFPSGSALAVTTTPLTAIGTWTAGGGGIGLVNSGITTKSMKFNHGTVGRISSATTPAVHGVANISYTGIVGTLATNLRLSGNSSLVYDKTIGTTNTFGSTLVPSSDSIFTFAYTETATTPSEYLDNIIFTFTSPTSQATAAAIPNVGTTGMNISWTRPNGGKDNQGSIVFVGDDATATWANPANASSYTANTAFGSGSQIGTTGYYCVYNGNQNNVSITGLTQGHTYTVYVLEYNGIAAQSDEIYNTTSPATVSQLIPSCATPTLTTATQTGTTCQGTGATISLTGLVPSHAGLTISYTVDGAAVQTATGVSSDAFGAGSFTTSNLAITANGKILQITNIADGSCTQSFAQNVTLTVDATTIAGTVAAAQTICTGSSPSNLTLSGNTGSIIEWMSAPTAGFSAPTDIANTTNTLTSATMGSLSANTYYRAMVKNGACAAVNSTSALITVSPASVGGTAAYAGTTICAGNVPSASVTLTGNTGTITWQKSTDASFTTGVTTVAGTGATVTAATIGTLSATTYVRAVVTSGACAATYSAATTITVTPASVGGSVSGGSTICSGNTPSSDLTLNGSTGSVTKWQSSAFANFSASTDIANTTTTLTAASIGALNTTTYFRAVVQSGSCSAANATADVVVVNSPSFTATNATAAAGIAVTYTTQTGESNYSWTYSGVANTDFVITAGGSSLDNSVTLKWVTTGTQTVSVNYTAAGGCTAAAPASTNTTVSAYTTAATDYFRSNVASGSWASAASWQSSPDNATWFTASSVPTSAAAAITIQANHNITASAAVTVPASFTVNGTYTHNQNGGTIPSATWGNSSTCSVTGVTSITTIAGLGQTFNNFTWNCTSQTSSFQAASAFTTVNGTLTIAATGTGNFRLTACNGTSNITSIGSLAMTGGNFYLMAGGGAGTNTSIVNIAGDATLSNASYINFNGAFASYGTTLNIGGNLSISGTSYLDQSIANSSNKISSLNFIKSSGTQTFSISSSNASPFAGTRTITMNIGSASASPTVVLGNSLNTGLGPIAILGNAKLNIGSNTITTPSIAAAGKLIGSASSSIILNGTTASTFNFSTTVSTDNLLNSLTLSGIGKVTLGTNLGITTLLSLSNASSVLDINGHNLTLKSNAAGTAEVAQMNGSIIDGTQASPYTATNVTVERYIPKGKRNYRDLGPSVANAGSVFANWQENGAGSTSYTYGFYVTGKTGTPGYSSFDQTSGFDLTTKGGS